MPQYYTLEEAAKVLQMPLEELREKAKKKEIRAFQDRGNWRFRAQEIDELARERGIGSEPELQLREATSKSPPPRRASDGNPVESDVVPIGKEKPPEKRSTKSGPRSPSPSPRPGSGDSDVRLVKDSNIDFQIEPDSNVKVESGPKSSGNRPPPPRKSKVVADSGVRLVDKPSDSDVKVVPSGKDSDVVKGKGPSDSDIRLQDLPSSARKKGPEAGIITEEIDLDAEKARDAEKPRPPAKKPKSGTPPVLPTTSPFELSEEDLNLDETKKSGSRAGPKSSGAGPKSSGVGPKSSGTRPKPKSSLKPKSEVDSSSDFELIPFDSSKSPGELGSGEIPLLSGDEDIGLGDLPRPTAGNSGINLQDPADSGLSLESGGSDELEFELSLDSVSTPKPTSSKKPIAEDSSSEFELSLDDSSTGEDSSSEFELSLDADSDTVGLQKIDENSSSEFELTLDDEGALAGADEDAKDIFEETNFDVPALDDESGSEAVALDEADDTDLEGSDFEISLDDDSTTGEQSDSQVVALEDEEEADDAAATIARPRKTKTASKARLIPDEDESELDLGDLESGPRKKKRIDVEDEEEAEEEEEEEVAAAAAPPAEWGPLPAILLAPAVLALFLVSLMGFEMIQSMWGYHRPAKVGRPVIEGIARTFDESLPKD
jgi:excisionase family DNA binding protein